MGAAAVLIPAGPGRAEHERVLDLERGFGVVHSLKNDPAHDERALRSFFAAARA